MLYPPQASSSSFIPSPPNQPPTKKKRGHPGNPDPDAEVIALSPKSLLETNRFKCEVCKKGFKRDQNLQLHRRGHNLPWKLKQRDKEQVIRKKVYVCPVTTCVHHDPARALGDLTGVKKHYCRKHCDKKWKCNKCSKNYAVQSDWKAHSKICGTKEYRCDCGTLFSRRDSFITHRAFCDALTEGGRGGIISSTILPNLITQCSTKLHNPPNSFPLKREYDDQSFNFNTRLDNIPSWLTCPPPSMTPQQQPGHESGHSSQMEDQLILFQQYNNQYQQSFNDPNPSQMDDMGHIESTLSSPYISTTSLLQRGVEGGVMVNNSSNQQQYNQYQQYQLQNQNQNQSHIQNQNQNQNQSRIQNQSQNQNQNHIQNQNQNQNQSHIQNQNQNQSHIQNQNQNQQSRQVSSHEVMFTSSNNNSNNKTQPHIHMSMGISPSSREFDHYSNTNFIQGQGGGEEAQSCMLHDMMIMSSFQSSTFTKPISTYHNQAAPSFDEFHQHHLHKVAEPKPPPPTDGGAKRGGGEGLTRDFLGLRPSYFHKDFLNMAGLSNINSPSSSSPRQQLDHHNQKLW